MSSQPTAAQDLAQGLSSDLKLTNIVALATMTAAMIVILIAMFSEFNGWTITGDTTIAFVGGVCGVLVVYLGAQAATGGAYVNAVASLQGVNVVAGATPPATPSTNTTGTQITGSNLALANLSTEQITALANLTPAQTAALQAILAVL